MALVLDEVWDPQNFGALLRSAYFLGVQQVVVCAKNSAPLSAVVSKASAGVMELMKIYSTDNLMRFLDATKENGWQVVGTALGEKSVPLKELPLQKPTLLVLGNEGHGIRTNILKRCDHLVKIDKGFGDQDLVLDVGDDVEESVDSLNVSVTGGIMMHYLLNQSPAPPKA